jgi:exportin-T
MDKISGFLSIPPVGTDDEVGLVNLRKAFLNLLGVILNSGLDSVLTCQENLGDLVSTMERIMSCFDTHSDKNTLKIAFSILGKFVFCFGGTDLNITLYAQKSKKASKPNGLLLRRAPLQGFDSFIFESMVPVAFVIPSKEGFNFTDGQSLLVLTEIANLHILIHKVLGKVYLDYLSNYLPSIQMPQTMTQQFITTLVQGDPKAFRKFITLFYSNLAGPFH